MIRKVISEVSETRIAEILKKIESIGTRNTMSDPNQPDRGVGAAWKWIFDQFKRYSPRLDEKHADRSDGFRHEISGPGRPREPGGGLLDASAPQLSVTVATAHWLLTNRSNSPMNWAY
jgi:hypothetical protein